MQTQIVPGARGWRWLPAGFALYRRNPLALGVIVVGYWLMMILASAVPFIGQFATTVCIPVFAVGIMNACRDIERHRPVPPALLFSAFRPNPVPLLTLGAVYLVMTLSTLALTSFADGGVLLRLMLGDETSREALETPGFLLACELGIVLMVPVMMAYWFAPVLVAWHGFSPAKALFFSFFACLRNWRPFVGYALSLIIWGVVVPGFIVGILASVLPQGGGAVAILTAPLIFVLAPTLFASFYVTYCDVFADSGHVDTHA